MKFVVVFLLACTFHATKAITFKCTYSPYDNAYSGPGYQCLGSQVLTAGNSSHVTSITGSSTENLKVNSLVFNRGIAVCSEITQVPKGLMSFFPKLDFLALNNCGIETLRGDELVEYPNLKRFDLSGGNIQYLPSRFFAPTPLMEVIYFDGNKIKNVGVDLLNYTKNLKIAMFYNQECIHSSTFMNPAEYAVPRLITELHTKCPDIEIRPQCEVGNNDERICALEKDNANLKKVLGIVFNEIAKNLNVWSSNMTDILAFL